MTGPDVIAHRGYSAVAPENTLPAFAAAVAAGADWVELDVRTTADGVPVVIHDRTLDRTTAGTGPVADCPAGDLATLDAGSWFSPAYAGVPVPTLAAALDLLDRAGTRILLEIKPPATGAEVEAVVAQVAGRGLTARTILQSIDDDVLRAAAAALPDLRRGVLRFTPDPDPVRACVEHRAVCYNPSLKDLVRDPELAPRLQATGVRVMPWTVNTAAGWADAVDLGVDGIITDRPAACAAWLGAPATAAA